MSGTEPLVRLGRTDVEVSRLGFGAASLGNLYRAIDGETAQSAVDAAWAAGVRYFDTAPHYGLGLSERRLGAALAGWPRAEFTISTKVGRLLVPNLDRTGSDLASGGFDVPDDLTRQRDYSRSGVLRSLEESLERLGLDHVDVVYVHDPEDHLDQAIGEALPALAELRSQGVVGAIGAGMNFVEPLQRIVQESDVDAVMVAGRWSLVDRSAADLLALCSARGVSVVVAAPFNSGLLARPFPSDDARFDYGPAPAPLLRLAREIAGIAAAAGDSLPHLAVRFPLRDPAVASVVIGMGTAHHVDQAARWFAQDVEPDLWERVDRTVQGDTA
jgi:D-threo-aldose 1-dehydrogenase